MDNWSHSIKFVALCEFLESLNLETVKERKRQKLDKFFTKCREACPKEYDLFPILRLLLPKLDQERGSYGIKETVFAKVSGVINH